MSNQPLVVGTADSGPTGADRGRLGRGPNFRPVIGADWDPVGFDRYFGGVTPPVCGGLSRGRRLLGIHRRLRSALRYPYIRSKVNLKCSMTSQVLWDQLQFWTKLGLLRPTWVVQGLKPVFMHSKALFWTLLEIYTGKNFKRKTVDQ